jgi:hypothetical protein
MERIGDWLVVGGVKGGAGGHGGLVEYIHSKLAISTAASGWLSRTEISIRTFQGAEGCGQLFIKRFDTFVG